MAAWAQGWWDFLWHVEGFCVLWAQQAVFIVLPVIITAVLKICSLFFLCHSFPCQTKQFYINLSKNLNTSFFFSFKALYRYFSIKDKWKLGIICICVCQKLPWPSICACAFRESWHIAHIQCMYEAHVFNPLLRCRVGTRRCEGFLIALLP